ncbi:hypothetical protein VTH06DRAFT_7515 [Thermothelomyces fergusii]
MTSLPCLPIDHGLGTRTSMSGTACLAPSRRQSALFLESRDQIPVATAPVDKSTVIQQSQSAASPVAET